VYVEGFDDLLKLSILHSGHIDLYRNRDTAEFSVLVGEHLYYYAVNLAAGSLG